MSKRDYYEVLGIDKSASKKDLKSAYRKAAKQYHPDRNKAPDAEAKFKEVQEAYDVLSDDQKRKAYDQFGHAGTEGFGGGGAGFNGGGFGFEDMGNINDIFEQFFGGGFSGFSGFSGRGPANQPKRGQDIETTVKLTFEEAVFGTEKKIDYKRKVRCNTCNGSGAKQGTTPETCPTCNGQGRVARVQQTFLGNIQTVVTCSNCGGEGKVIKEKCSVCFGNGVKEEVSNFAMKVPQGIPDGVTLRFKDRGNAGHKGGSYGDLFINIEVQPDENLERRGDDIYTDVQIDAVTAVLGDSIQVRTVHGKKELKIPAGTQPETVLKMSGDGAPRFRGKGNGNQYVRIMVTIPKSLTKEQKQLWESLNKIKDDKAGFIDRIFS